MIYGQAPQLDPRHPSFTFTYNLTGATRLKAITIVDPTESIAKAHAAMELDRWHGPGRWEWHDHE